MNKTKFESWMEQRYVELGYMDMDNFWDWMEGQPTENLVEYVDEFADEIRKGKVK